MSPQIIFSDVDGTLLNSDHKVLPGTLYAIRELQDKGVPFVIISGRKVLLSFFIFLITLMMCVSGTFSYAED